MTDANLYGFMLAVSILLAALAVDRILGEYPTSVHPVVWIGTAIGKLDPVYRKIGGFLGGLLFVVTVEAIFIIPLYAVIHYLAPFVILQAIVIIFFLKATFSIRGMNDHVRPIISALESGDIESARKHLSMVVRRDTSGMESGLICSAAIDDIHLYGSMISVHADKSGTENISSSGRQYFGFKDPGNNGRRCH